MLCNFWKLFNFCYAVSSHILKTLQSRGVTFINLFINIMTGTLLINLVVKFSKLQEKYATSKSKRAYNQTA